MFYISVGKSVLNSREFIISYHYWTVIISVPRPIIVHCFFNVLPYFSTLVIKHLRWTNCTQPNLSTCFNLFQSFMQSTFRLIFTLSMWEWKSNNVRMSSHWLHKIPIYSGSSTRGRKKYKVNLILTLKKHFLYWIIKWRMWGTWQYKEKRWCENLEAFGIILC